MKITKEDVEKELKRLLPKSYKAFIVVNQGSKQYPLIAVIFRVSMVDTVSDPQHLKSLLSYQLRTFLDEARGKLKPIIAELTGN